MESACLHGYLDYGTAPPAWHGLALRFTAVNGESRDMHSCSGGLMCDARITCPRLVDLYWAGHIIILLQVCLSIDSIAIATPGVVDYCGPVQ